ncbi:hypothetical protein SAOUHSC_A02273 [Staphylococcus aureus subsp. aureus NCTC 8325]|uniref:Uncharacterized protein n=1 Tax=Staphylococcus aureus (strain NCTC 8325 / PS 47) TaxID=93061 RepID=Q2FWA3_STAA8|nr:hypothetical protein SAOUHSC_A02273 [Staphylococcus aureus subsp. aureus NCTC 8325]
MIFILYTLAFIVCLPTLSCLVFFITLVLNVIFTKKKTLKYLKLTLFIHFVLL